MKLAMKFVRCVLLILLTAFVPAHYAFADSASDDFSSSLNPSGNWRYGWETTLGGAFNSFVQRQTQSGIDFWFQPIAAGPSPGYPFVGHNPSAQSITVPGATVLADQIVLHPGPGNQYAVLRWVAPQDIELSIAADFSRVDFAGPTTTDVHVLINGVSAFDALLNASNASASFNGLALVTAGTTIDFAVGFGANGNYFNDTAGLFATVGAPPVTAVPEPSSWLLLAGGIGLVAAVRGRRRPPTAA